MKIFIQIHQLDIAIRFWNVYKFQILTIFPVS